MTTVKDQQTVIAAVQAARQVLGAYVEPGPRDPAATMNEMLRILDDDKIVAALERLDRRSTFKLVH